MPSQDHMIKKLLLLFWEVVPKYGSDGKLLHEMILVCDAYRKDLQHPNEFIRGSTLRFLCKLKEPELLEPIMPSIQQCLEHRHAYVRRNAVLAIFTIYKNFESLIPDAPERILRFLEQEQDSSCKRNAFMMLLHVSQSTALDYLTSCLDEVQNFGDILQLVVVELIYKDLVMDIVQIINASDMEVRQKALDLTMDLVTAQLIKACSTNTRASATTSDSTKTPGEEEQNSDESVYRYSLVHTIYDISLRFPEILPTIVPTICDILTYEEINDTRAANEACRFLREIMERFPDKKADVLEKLMQVFPSIVGRETLRHVLWIFGEYCTTYEEINAFITLVRQVIGELPLVDEELRRQADQVNSMDPSSENRNQPSVLISGDVNVGVNPAQRVTADGTYATQSALTLRSNKDASGSGNTVKRPVLQAALFESHYMPGVVLSVCLVKLFYRYSCILNCEQNKAGKDEGVKSKFTSKENSFAAECMLIIASMIHLATSQLLPHQVNPDHLDRMWICLKILADRRPEVLEAFERTSRACLAEMLTYQESERKSNAKARNQGLIEHQKQLAELNRADAPIKFSLLTGQTEFGDTVDRFDLTLSQALGAAGKGASGDAYATSKLNKVSVNCNFCQVFISLWHSHN
ncbi:unnamed protein product [Trichobilharzia regenti]|nr:unnamed protein product [Trichobilharzia regenti]